MASCKASWMVLKRPSSTNLVSCFSSSFVNSTLMRHLPTDHTPPSQNPATPKSPPYRSSYGPEAASTKCSGSQMMAPESSSGKAFRHHGCGYKIPVRLSDSPLQNKPLPAAHLPLASPG